MTLLHTHTGTRTYLGGCGNTPSQQYGARHGCSPLLIPGCCLLPLSPTPTPEHRLCPTHGSLKREASRHLLPKFG
ncbi:hypothetical protein E2C01_011660 [Portunus trituberculatus]|uniref:Uncharacterized protein n=1 Tax=Portunus trituberculatus TaxID=210409 RepID=A0A5B7DC18_PORTR|nr:hypothetical protein [Portunus trituberculatus]